ncbi:MAG: TMEM165/GDT1 family protein [Actinobacteria bacterium]|nr:TMEM165/GDT1 family protein [Actinomycetota bacterium]MCL5886824.1 TMEM165/GDT1 family protein [Actinomycetota bacterium]
MEAFVFTFALVALAEFGDKSQLLTLLFATRFRLASVLLGVGLGVVILQTAAVATGASFGAILPDRLVGIISGALFIVFGVLSLRPRKEQAAEVGEAAGSALMRFGPTIGIAVAFVLSEFGDKTQLTTLFIASDPQAALGALSFLGMSFEAGPLSPADILLPVWVGSIAGLLAVNLLALVVGRTMGKRLPVRLVSWIAGILFLSVGAYLLLSAVFAG